jgi:peroxin-5
MNIGCFREAAEHFLAALSLHETKHAGQLGQDGNGVQVHVSKTLWDTLHRNFIMVRV